MFDHEAYARQGPAFEVFFRVGILEDPVGSSAGAASPRRPARTSWRSICENQTSTKLIHDAWADAKRMRTRELSPSHSYTFEYLWTA